MKKINFLAGLCVLVATLAVAGHVRGADIATSVIDFESGTVNNGEARAENLFVSEITTPDNVVSFGLDGIDVVPVLALSNSGVQAAFNVKPSGPDDTATGQVGRWSLGSRTKHTEDYVISFANPVSNFSVDLYDFRADGSENDGNPGIDTIQLQAWLGGSAVPLVAGPSNTYTVPDPLPVDGNIVNLSAGSTVLDKVILKVIAGTPDRGTAIDNIRFTTTPNVPEPATMTLAGLGVMGSLGLLRRRKR